VYINIQYNINMPDLVNHCYLTQYPNSPVYVGELNPALAPNPLVAGGIPNPAIPLNPLPPTVANLPAGISGDMFEIYIKTYLEPVFVQVFRYVNRIVHSFNNAILTVTGGDSINYYLPANKQIPSHDFDIRIINLADPQFPANNLANMIALQRLVLQIFRDAFNGFLYIQREAYNADPNRAFKTLLTDAIFDTQFFIDQNPMNNAMPYLSTLNFRYTIGGVQQENSILDLTLFGEGQMGAGGQHYLPKRLNVQDVAGNDLSSQAIMARYVNERNLFYKTPEAVVMDQGTEIVYMTLGDIVNDTIRMIHWTLNNPAFIANPVDPSNKIIKYLKKYSELISVVERMATDFQCNVFNFPLIVCVNITQQGCAGGATIAGVDDVQGLANRLNNAYYTTPAPAGLPIPQGSPLLNPSPYHLINHNLFPAGLPVPPDVNIIDTYPKNRLCEMVRVLGV